MELSPRNRKMLSYRDIIYENLLLFLENANAYSTFRAGYSYLPKPHIPHCHYILTHHPEALQQGQFPCLSQLHLLGSPPYQPVLPRGQFMCYC